MVEDAIQTEHIATWMAEDTTQTQHSYLNGTGRYANRAQLSEW